MINIGLKEVHIGMEIDKRRNELDINKSDFARKVGIQQQHVNRIFKKDTIDTGRLSKICQVLDFNFYSLYCELPQSVNAFLAAVALNGNALNNIGDAALASQLKAALEKIDSLEKDVALRDDTIRRQDSQLKDKDAIIELLREKKQQ